MRQTRKINWDASTPQVMLSEFGRPIGRLMPRIDKRVLAASPGVQSHSIPGYASRVSLYDGGASIANFGEYWARHTGRTYPFSVRSETE